MLIGCFVFASAASFAEVPPGATRASPLSYFTTHKTSAEFAECVLDASRGEFPASSVEPKQTGRIITVSRAPSADAAAIIDVEDGSGGVRMVTMRTASGAQPLRDPSAKIARNCQ
jgi:hypothetical protein